MLVMEPKIYQLILVLWLNLRMILIFALYISGNPKGLSIEYLETIKLFLDGLLFIPLKRCVPTYTRLYMVACCYVVNHIVYGLLLLLLKNHNWIQKHILNC